MPNIKALSIKKVYAEKIIKGTKTIELRKRALGINVGDLILLYETVPDSLIRGGFIASRTFSLHPDAMWEINNTKLGIDKNAYDEYYAGGSSAYGIEIFRSFAFPHLQLSSIIDHCPDFVPPQALINWHSDWITYPEWFNALQEGRQGLIENGLLANQLSLFEI